MPSPIGSKVLICPDEINVQTEAGLYIVTKEVPTTGTVVSISPDIDKEELELNNLREGSKVKYAANHRIDEEGFVLIEFENIYWVENE
jgi:co-chaperonin GroES (HSP10)